MLLILLNRIIILFILFLFMGNIPYEYSTAVLTFISFFIISRLVLKTFISKLREIKLPLICTEVFWWSFFEKGGSISMFIIMLFFIHIIFSIEVTKIDLEFNLLSYPTVLFFMSILESIYAKKIDIDRKVAKYIRCEDCGHWGHQNNLLKSKLAMCPNCGSSLGLTNCLDVDNFMEIIRREKRKIIENILNKRDEDHQAREIEANIKSLLNQRRVRILIKHKSEDNIIEYFQKILDRTTKIFHEVKFLSLHEIYKQRLTSNINLWQMTIDSEIRKINKLKLNHLSLSKYLENLKELYDQKCTNIEINLEKDLTHYITVINIDREGFYR